LTLASHNAFVLEEIAQLALLTIAIDSRANPIFDSLRDRHFL
jgi:ribulose-5-phosphate 4-epimerase/fuculose-1-phosphate aldolase